MKKLLPVLVLAAAGFFAYQQIVLRAPDRAFQRFADAWAREDTPEAVALTEGEAARRAVETKILRGVSRVPMEAYRGSRMTIEARVALPGGQLALTGKQVVRFDPPGANTGIGGAMAASFRHVVRLKETPAGWRVVSFEPVFLDAVETRRRP